jgi:hypothetical protein
MKKPDQSDKKDVLVDGKIVGEVYSLRYPFCIIRIKQEYKEKNLTVLGSSLKLLN